MSSSQWKRTVRGDNAARALWEADVTALAELPVRPTRQVHQRTSHHATLASIAWVDAKKLVGIVVGDTPITLDELLRYCVGASAAQKQALAVQPIERVPTEKAPADQTPAQMENDALHKTQRTIQRKLLRALDLRFANNPKGKALITSIRRGRNLTDCLDDTRRIKALVHSDEHKAWFVSLTRGEPAELARLETLDATLRTRLDLKALEDDSDAATKRRHDEARLHAMLTMLDALERRVVLAGRYVWQGEDRAKQYRRFASTRRRTRAKKTTPT